MDSARCTNAMVARGGQGHGESVVFGIGGPIFWLCHLWGRIFGAKGLLTLRHCLPLFLGGPRGLGHPEQPQETLSSRCPSGAVWLCCGRPRCILGTCDMENPFPGALQASDPGRALPRTGQPGQTGTGPLQWHPSTATPPLGSVQTWPGPFFGDTLFLEHLLSSEGII